MALYGNGGDGKGGSDKSDRLIGHVQDPALVQVDSSSTEARKNRIADDILNRFCDSLPSNYASRVRGPFYQHLFRAFAEGLAEFQIEAELISDDHRDLGLTRSDFLYQLLGRLVFPDSVEKGAAVVEVDGDVPLRTFFQEMVKFLLEGSRQKPINDALGFLSDASVEIVAKSEHAGDVSAWGLDSQFEFEINTIAHKETDKEGHSHWHRLRIDGQGNGETKNTYFNSKDRMEMHVHKVVNFEVQPYTDGKGVSHSHSCSQAFPDDPFALQHNISLILKALKPAHLIYEYRHLFVEGFGELFEDQAIYKHESWQYEDARKNWRGNKVYRGRGQTYGMDRSVLIDHDQDFSRIPPHATVRITDGLNEGEYRVQEAMPLPVMSDPVRRQYETIPTGLTGFAQVLNGEIVTVDLGFHLCVPGEKFVFKEGPNEGTYRIGSLLGNGGGPLGTKPTQRVNRIRLAHSLLKVRPRMTYAVHEQGYEIGLDRLGESEPKTVVGESVASQFIL